MFLASLAVDTVLCNFIEMDWRNAVVRQRPRLAESTTREVPHLAAIEGGRPGGGTNIASNDSLRFPSARRFQERRRPRYPGTSRSIPA